MQSEVGATLGLYGSVIGIVDGEISGQADHHDCTYPLVVNYKLRIVAEFRRKGCVDIGLTCMYSPVKATYVVG
jgi:hypothetical protein